MSNTRVGKRILSKKVTSFNMYLDQASQIQAIMESTCVEKDAQVLRELLDEALAGRRRKIAQQLVLPETPSGVSSNNEILEIIQSLLLKLVEQGEKARFVRGISLELLQEALAESRAGRTLISKTIKLSSQDNALLKNVCEDEIDQAKQHAFNLAIEIAKGKNLERALLSSPSPTVVVNAAMDSDCSVHRSNSD
jgi:hypothetical protein